MKGKALILFGFLVAVAVIILIARRGGLGNAGAGPAGGGARADAVEVAFLYSTEKKDWIEAAVAAFAKEHPEVSVKLIGMGSLEAAQALLEGKQQPVLWSPADSLVLNLAAADWETKTGSRLVAASGTEDAPEPLVLTPLVFVIWEDRAEVLQKATHGQITWKAIRDAVVSNRGWPAIGGKPEWGFVKLGHTDPTRSNSGLQALLLMTLEYYKKTSGLEVGDLLKPDYQQWIREIERGVSRFERSTGTFMTDMVRFGPSKYDLAVVYESLAISQLENAQGRWGNLKVYYPASTLWSDHPVALLQGSWITPAQKKAATALVSYLRSRPVQAQALNWGFRPADPAVPIRTADAHNPFSRLAAFGVQLEIPPAATPPDAPVIRNLITMWSRVVGNR
ncbi:MAG TPA: substrate-binding domain-containing protein [Polyangia bacterium]|nr:substrate-binding domain-containing protein [Polyangia bacterium]